MRTHPTCFILPTVVPGEPMRDPRSRRSLKDCAINMAEVMAELMAHYGVVTKDDLHRAGFSNGEIDHCHVEAVRLCDERMKPRQVDQDVYQPEAA